MNPVFESLNNFIKDLQDDNQELRKIIAEQDGKLERAIIAIYQLHGGLYNQRTQGYSLGLANASLFGDVKPIGDDKECIWFTTRQGDDNADRITKLEEKLEEMEKKILKMEANK